MELRTKRERFFLILFILFITGFLYQNYKRGEFRKLYLRFFKKSKNFIYVGITGAVLKPAVYKLKKGTKLKTLVKISGGYTKYAMKDVLNENYVLKNREIVFVPFKKINKNRGIGFGVAPSKKYLIKPLKLVEEN